MTELSFAKAFLSSLDSRPVRIPYDYVVDPATIPIRGPYALPRLSSPHPTLPKKRKTADGTIESTNETTAMTTNPGASKSISCVLKSARNPLLDITLSSLPLSTTTVQDLRDSVQQRVTTTDGATVSLDKIKILYRKKPVSGSPEKTVAEIIGDNEPDQTALKSLLGGGKTVEFGVMIMGGAVVKPDNPPLTSSGSNSTKPAHGSSVRALLKSAEFWNDLEGFLEHRVKDRDEALRVTHLFKTAWERGEEAS